MILTLGTLAHEVRVGGSGDRAAFDREGYVVGRGVLGPDVLRKLRAPLIEALVAEGQVELVDDDEDRFVWCGDKAGYGRARTQAKLDIEQLLVASGVLGRSIEAMWGRRANLWVGRLNLFVMFPNDPDRVHRDGWQMMGTGGSDEHLNVWIPLTRLGTDDGALAIAIGSHRISDEPADIPVIHPMHQDVLAISGNNPLPERLAPLWRTTTFEVGDALAFRPDMVHSASGNDGPYLRLAIGFGAYDASLPPPAKAGLSLDPGRDLVDIEWLTLAIVAVQPSTPWLARQAFYSRGIIGRLWSEQPDELVGRAFTILERRGLIEPDETQAGQGSGIHRYFHATPKGRSEVSRWLLAPSSDELLSAKLLFCDWLGLDGMSLLTIQDSGSPRIADL